MYFLCLAAIAALSAIKKLPINFSKFIPKRKRAWLSLFDDDENLCITLIRCDFPSAICKDSFFNPHFVGFKIPRYSPP